MAPIYGKVCQLDSLANWLHSKGKLDSLRHHGVEGRAAGASNTAAEGLAVRRTIPLVSVSNLADRGFRIVFTRL
jgi:hypothetical protein